MTAKQMRERLEEFDRYLLSRPGGYRTRGGSVAICPHCHWPPDTNAGRKYWAGRTPQHNHGCPHNDAVLTASRDDAPGLVIVCAGPPACLLEGDDAVANAKAGCPLCRRVIPGAREGCEVEIGAGRA